MNQRLRVRRLLLSIALASVLAGGFVFTQSADAISTRTFRLDSAAEFDGGELDGAMVHSDGHLSAGVSTERVGLEGVPIARCLAPGAGGSWLVGTGDEGKIYRLRGGSSEVFAETGQLMVASCVAGGGTLYAGTIPEGRIFAVELTSGNVRELAQLEDTQHVWSLVLEGGFLYAGTGPEGKVFRIDTQSGATEVVLDTDQGHVLSLAYDGALYAGTDGEAIVYRVDGDDVSVVADFPGNEITALAARDGMLSVVANEMPAPRTTSTSTKAPSKLAAARRARPGKGRLFRVDGDGRVERVFAVETEHFASVAIDSEGVTLIGSGLEGRVYRVASDRTSATWLDLDERQVLGIDVSGASPTLITGDSAALYRTQPAGADPFWISKVLDAEYRSRFGRLTWTGTGGASVASRSGNTAEPDESWTEWSTDLTTPGPVRSASARYIQVRARLRADAEIRQIELFYLPQNQRAVLGNIGLKAPSKKQARDALPEASTRVELTWSVTNPDEDSLRYRLRFRAENQSLWRDMFSEDVIHTATNYTWDTSGIPDGLYIIEVKATDAIANPADLALADSRESETILVDNHAPDIILALRRGSLAGSVTDTLGPIRRIEWSVDNGPFRPAHTDDGLLDERSEAFAIDVSSVGSGSHLFALRAYDAGGNRRTAEVVGTIR
ncbi:MAG: hypothetical protein ACI9KE_001035 [Polyangiales bacterium]|jgi:hypothetical protein